MNRAIVLTVVVLAPLGCSLGCGGPSAEQWQASQQTVAKLQGDLEAANKRHAEDERKNTQAMGEIADLKAKVVLAFDGYNSVMRTAVEQKLRIDDLTREQQSAEAPPPADAQGWHQLGAGPIVGLDQCQVALATTFEPSAALANVVVRRVFIRQTFSPRASCRKAPWRVLTNQVDFDCGARTWRVRAGTNVDWNDNQSIVHEFSDVATPVFPDTLPETEWRYVCGKK